MQDIDVVLIIIPVMNVRDRSRLNSKTFMPRATADDSIFCKSIMDKLFIIIITISKSETQAAA